MNRLIDNLYQNNKDGHKFTKSFSRFYLHPTLTTEYQ